MNKLKPGYIPDGWTPGDHVHVVEAKPGVPGAVVHAPKGIRHALMTDGQRGDVAMILWRYEDTEEVANWLAWWREQRTLKVYERPH